MNPQSGLNPFPEGWFFVCYDDQLKRDTLLTKQFMGREIVAFRDAAGRARVLDAVCPHLGAHMGRGGCVRDGMVECPFHRFRFDGDGACRSTPYGEPPKKARARAWPVQEVDGLIMAYHDTQGRAPSWRIPGRDLDGWSKLARHHYRIKGHPQDTTENGVDSAHLITIHGYDRVEPTRPLSIEGPHLSGGYRMERDSRLGPFGKLGLKLEVEFDVDVWGLGHSTVEIYAPKLGMRVRLLTLATPSDGEHIDLHIALRVKEFERPERILPGLDRVPPAWLRSVALRLAKRAYMHDIEQDFFIWQNKDYLARPNLARGDGPVMAYRRYCRQFYPELRGQQEGAAAAE